jgi:hypothetical protein
MANSPECIAADAVTPKHALNGVVLSAYKTLPAKPAPDAFVGEVPDVLIFAVMPGRQDVFCIPEDRQRHKHPLTARATAASGSSMCSSESQNVSAGNHRQENGS